MIQPPMIIGAKGGKGGGGGGGASEADDSLRSDAYVGFVDLLGEGEWEGLVDGHQGIFINGSPLQNADGSYNFVVERIETRNGTQNQLPLSDFFDNAETPNTVGTEVRIDSGAVIRTISDSDVDRVRIIVTVPQLTFTDTSNGNIQGTSVTFAIDAQPDNGGFNPLIIDTISGKKGGSYQRQYEIDISQLAKPLDIRLRRLTPDSNSQFLANKLVWDTYTEIITGKLNYPNSVLAAMRLAAAQFSSIPARAYRARMTRIKVPMNYNPTTRTYTGNWDGTFKIAWSNNPAWAFYDMVTTSRYGLGEYVDPAQVDKWALYSIGQYCDELVDDGFGGKEPRFTMNVYLTEATEAFKVMQDLASCFRGMAFLQSGLITVAQDAPTTAQRLFTRANVVGGTFIYSGTSKKTRFTVVQVGWNDPADMYKRKVEYVEDADGINNYGWVAAPDGLTAFGCTSRGQAVRLGKWYLMNNLLETETITFRLGIEGATLRPAEVFKVMDNSRAGKQAAGRIHSCTTTTVTIDRDVTLAPGIENILHVAMPDQTLQSATILAIAGRVVTVATAYSTTPQPQGVWMITSETLAEQQFRVVAVAEENGEYEVTALKYTPTKYAALEQGLIIEPAPITTLTITPDQPANSKGSESLYAEQSQVKVVMTLDWGAVRAAVAYEIILTPPGGNATLLPITSTPTLDIRDALVGVYSWSIRAIGANGKKSTPATGSYEVRGKTALPSDVENFTMMPISTSLAVFNWDAAPDLDVSIGGFVRISHSPKVDGSATVANAIEIGTAIAGSATEASLPLMTGTYFAQFIDSSGNVSAAPASIITTVPNVQNLNVIDTPMDSPDFAGTKSYCEVDDALGGLTLSGAAQVDEWGMVDEMFTIDYYGGTSLQGTFTSAQIIDLGARYDVSLTSILEIATAGTDSVVDNWGPIDEISDIDGSSSSAGNAWFEISTTDDDPADPDPEWSEWRRFHAGEYPFRGLRRRLQLRSADRAITVIIKEAGIRLDLNDRVEAVSNNVSGTAAYDVVYQFPFWTTPPTPGITLQNGAAGDTFVISNETASGFRITFYNSAVIVNRTFAYMAKGQGKRQ